MKRPCIAIAGSALGVTLTVLGASALLPVRREGGQKGAG